MDSMNFTQTLQPENLPVLSKSLQPSESSQNCSSQAEQTTFFEKSKTTLQEKIQKIISVIKSGISIYKIDPIGKGGSAKMLLQGKMPTQKKILEMYTNALILQKVPTPQQPSSPEPDSDFLCNEQLRINKIKIILESANAGVPHNVIDPLGSGNSIRRLLNAGNCTPQKIDQMYNNILDYQQRQLLEKKQQFVLLNPHDNPDNDQKKALILQAVSSGIQKCRIDNSGGKAINRLLEGQDVLQVTLDMMYSNLLSLMGYSQDSSDSSSNSALGARQSYAYLQNQISSLQNVVASLLESLHTLQTAVSVLQAESGSSKIKNAPHKILGTTLMLKDDLVRGKKYRRWYALYLDIHNKRRWIYIGSNVSNAKPKILAWFERHPQDVLPR